MSWRSFGGVGVPLVWRVGWGLVAEGRKREGLLSVGGRKGKGRRSLSFGVGLGLGGWGVWKGKGVVWCEEGGGEGGGEAEGSKELRDKDEGLVGTNEEWERLKGRLEQVRSSVVGSQASTVTRSTDSVSVRFKARDNCDLFDVLVTLLGGLGKEDLQRGGKVTGEDENTLSLHATDAVSSSALYICSENEYLIYVFHPQIGPFSSEFTIRRFGRFFTSREVDSIVLAYERSQIDALPKEETEEETAQSSAKKKKKKHKARSNHEVDEEKVARAEKKLEGLGVSVFRADEPLAWEDLAGYDDVKTKIEDTVTLAMTHPEVYDRIASGTRKRFQTSRPRAVLFEGPPGCGKTTTGKILASQAGVPFVHVPLEAVLSKWFGDSERMLSKILTTAGDLGPALVFLDEVDALGASRDKELHEASRRVLSVLLRHIDGMEGQQPIVLIAATNRKSDLDQALLSRFDVIINFDLPDQKTREKVFALYAKHLTPQEIATLAANSDHMSGRSILDACKEAERKCAGRFIREKNTDADSLPTSQDYLNVLQHRAETGHF